MVVFFLCSCYKLSAHKTSMHLPNFLFSHFFNVIGNFLILKYFSLQEIERGNDCFFLSLLFLFIDIFFNIQIASIFIFVAYLKYPIEKHPFKF